MKILVVDDERAVRDSLRRALELQGYQVDLAADGAEALARLEANGQPDAVILDILMPGIDGLEVCRRIREEGNEVPVLMLTARDAVGDRVAGLDVGADDYLVKPFAPDELVLRVRRLLAGRTGSRLDALTRRELQVLRLLAEGESQADIASALVISPKTVATHIEHILNKLGVKSRAQAVGVAYRERLLEGWGPRSAEPHRGPAGEVGAGGFEPP
jgi:two-component system, OmpR family, response regulator MprA